MPRPAAPDWTRRALLAGGVALPLVACVPRARVLPIPAAMALAPAEGALIHAVDPALDAILDPAQPVATLTTGHQWLEGPTWVDANGAGNDGYLLFNDVPRNRMWRWDARAGAALFLEPSGLTGLVPAGIREAGANGLWHAGGGRLLLADSGSRAIAALDLATKARTVLTDRFDGRRFNSCNDLAMARDGAIYFTDPPYGLTDGDASALKELPFNGVYRLATDGTVALLDDSLARPNGIGLSPDERTLYVAVSDDARPVLMAYPLSPDGLPAGPGRTLRDFTPELQRRLPGLPDGMSVHPAGWLFASAPGGLHVLAPDGRTLGVIGAGRAVSNCCFGGADGRDLFLTASDRVLHLRLRSLG